MACPSPAYLAMLKTGRGTTYDKPWWDVLGGVAPEDGIAGPLDYADWRAVAERLVRAMYQKVEAVGEAEQRKGAGYPNWNRLQPQAATLWNAWLELPHPLFAASSTEAPKARDISYEAACVLENADEALVRMGVKTSTPAVPSTGQGGGGWVGYAMLAGVGYVLYREWKGGDE